MMPLLFNIKGKKALVIGSGGVGRRRAETLLNWGMAVTVVDGAEGITGPSGAVFHNRPYQPADLDDADLVVAATGDGELNRRVAQACRTKKIPVNRADDPADSDFIFPSVVRRGDLTIAVCTEGASPALTAAVKAELETRYPQEMARRVELLGLLRKAVLARPELSRTQRQALLREQAAMDMEELEEAWKKQRQSS